MSTRHSAFKPLLTRKEISLQEKNLFNLFRISTSRAVQAKKKKKIQKVKKKHLPPNSGGLEFSGYFILDLKTVKHQPCQEERELLNLSQKNDNCRIKMYTVCLGA